MEDFYSHEEWVLSLNCFLLNWHIYIIFFQLIIIWWASISCQTLSRHCGHSNEQTVSAFKGVVIKRLLGERLSKEVVLELRSAWWKGGRQIKIWGEEANRSNNNWKVLKAGTSLTFLWNGKKASILSFIKKGTKFQ